LSLAAADGGGTLGVLREEERHGDALGKRVAPEGSLAFGGSP
jgi:hypothetical protein